jgi:4-amino-4-deoxy-L-arabinose transferase-like glycosyltransferase
MWRAAPLTHPHGMNIELISKQSAPPSPRSARLGIGLVAVGAFAAEMAVSARYGYVRDELYFLAAGRHPAFGYVDQPPLTPLLARAWSVLTFNTLVGFRMLPALALVALVLATAAMSRLLGAGRVGQVLAALATAVCAQYMGAMHELTTTTPDFVFWAITLLLVTRLLVSRDPRWWVAIGASAGIGSEAKWNVAFLLAGLALGFAISPNGRVLARSRYLLFGTVIFLALATPDLVWQAMNGWPAFDVFHALQGQAWHNRATYWLGQFLFTGPVLTPVWIAGLWWTLRTPRFRPVAVACASVIVLQFVLGGKPYYPGGAYTFLFAAGAVVFERKFMRRGAVTTAALMVVGGLIASPISLPVLPARALHTVPLQKINYDLAESIGWPSLVGLVADEYRSLPAQQRAHTTILTGNYGEAGAFARYGAGAGLPEAYSGANNFWLWGPPPASGTSAIAVNLDPAMLRTQFTSVRQVATFSNGLGVDDDEQGVPVYLCTGLRSSWAHAWPAFRDFS